MIISGQLHSIILETAISVNTKGEINCSQSLPRTDRQIYCFSREKTMQMLHKNRIGTHIFKQRSHVCCDEQKRHFIVCFLGSTHYFQIYLSTFCPTTAIIGIRGESSPTTLPAINPWKICCEWPPGCVAADSGFAATSRWRYWSCPLIPAQCSFTSIATHQVTTNRFITTAIADGIPNNDLPELLGCKRLFYCLVALHI